MAHGVDVAFGVPGESYLAVLDALHDVRETLPLTVCRHEGGAANMAEAWGKLTGEPGVCFVTRGPGATNAAIGLQRLALIPDLDVIRRSRLNKATLFEMEPSPELEAVQNEYLRLAASLWAGAAPLEASPMKDRDIFDLLGFD